SPAASIHMTPAGYTRKAALAAAVVVVVMEAPAQTPMADAVAMVALALPVEPAVIRQCLLQGLLSLTAMAPVLSCTAGSSGSGGDGGLGGATAAATGSFNGGNGGNGGAAGLGAASGTLSVSVGGDLQMTNADIKVYGGDGGSGGNGGAGGDHTGNASGAAGN